MFVTIRVRVFTDNTGAYIEIPALLTPSGVLESLVEYCVEKSQSRSLSWMKKMIYAVQLFLKYLEANPPDGDPCSVFQNFALRLLSGTFDLKTRLDPTGLCWAPHSASDARNIMTHLSGFFLSRNKSLPVAAQINPSLQDDCFDRQISEAAYQYRRNAALLGHTWEKSAPQGPGRFAFPPRVPKVADADPPAFPEERFEELLQKGFLAGPRPDYRGALITLLLHGASFRESEPFHLYIEDVVPNPINPQQAAVLIHHPSEGIAPRDWWDKRGRRNNGNRAEYLAQEWGLLPRNKLMDSRRAGWKGGIHDGAYYKIAYWFLPVYGELFWNYWKIYLDQILNLQRDHPFAFVNLHRDPLGAMYTVHQYNKAHAAACERIGLTASKALGTTPHGHRHAYGQRVKKAKLHPKFIQRYMHHARIESQQRYTEAYRSEVMSELEAAAHRMHDKYGGSGCDFDRERATDDDEEG